MSHSHGTVASHGPPRHRYIHIITIVFLSIALYNVLELTIIVAGTFKRFRGLYCWSVLVTTLGIAINAIGFLLRTLKVFDSPYVYSTVTLIGWVTMVTGQSLVLYSRLHIVLHREKWLRSVLYMIIINAVWVSTPVIVLVYLVSSDNTGRYILGYSIAEKLQLSVFFLQEVVISALYLSETLKITKSHRGLTSGTRKIMSQVIIINIVIICLDVSILALEFANLFNIQTAWKPMVYSIKLKMEFSVLNRLVELSQYVRRNRSFALNELPPDELVAVPSNVLAIGLGANGRHGGETPSYARGQPSLEHNSKSSQSDAVISEVQRE